MRFVSKILLALTLMAGSTSAIEITDLYGGQAIVTGIFEPERTRGLRQVLLDVLVKVSAEPRLIDDPRVQPLLDRAKDFIASYEYEDRMKGTPVRDEQGTRDRPHDLRITFNRARIDTALAELGLQPWTSERPYLSAWITIKYPDNSFVLTADGKQGLGERDSLIAAGARRGMVVGIPSATFTSGRPSSVPLAPAPEKTVRLSGTLSWQPDRSSWHTDWTLTETQFKPVPDKSFISKELRSWSVETTSFDEAFRNGVGEAAATLAGRR